MKFVHKLTSNITKQWLGGAFINKDKQFKITNHKFQSMPLKSYLLAWNEIWSDLIFLPRTENPGDIVKDVNFKRI